MTTESVEHGVSGHGLTLFGGFDLTDDRGAPIPVPSKKSRCLLAYLALDGGQHIRRDTLANLLWSDRDDTRARHSLSQELYRLRGLFPEEDQAAFDLSAETVSLAPDLLDVDVVKFERGLDAGEPEVAALYVGDLMAGLDAGQEDFDEWLRTERERLRDRAITAWHEVLRAQMDGPTERAIESASRLLSIDPTSEEAHRAQMQLYVNSGRRDLALRQYQKCKDVLSTELGIEPDVLTRNLHEKISATPEPANAGAATPGVRELAPNEEVAMRDQPLPLPSKPSIAVLPFDNMSDDPAQEYFSGGIADDIVTGLSRFRDLFVISRSSSFTYKASAVNIKQVGRELGVRYVLEGGVRKAGNRLRITAQLIEAESGNHLWAEKYDGDLADIFDLQDDITSSVVGAIYPQILTAEIDHARRGRPGNIDAYDLYLRGLWHQIHMTKESFAEARRLYRSCLDLDDTVAVAWSCLAFLNVIEVFSGWSENAQHNYIEAIDCGHRSIRHDEGDAQAHAMLAFPLLFSKQWDTADAEAERAVELNPNLSFAHLARALVRSYTGRPAEGLAAITLAIRLSPRDPFRFAHLNGLALCHMAKRDWQAELESAAKLVALRPDYLFGHFHVAVACGHLGQVDRGRKALDEIVRLYPPFDNAFIDATLPFEDQAETDTTMEALRKSGWQD